MWTVATYEPTTLFSLRPALSTTSGGQTLVVPTPFAVKMALLDVAIRSWGLAQGQAWFPAIRDLQLAVAGPRRLVVSHTFIKVLRLKKRGPSDDNGSGIVGPLGQTIAFRAFVQFAGPLRLALAPGGAVIPAVGARNRKAATTAPPADLPLAALLAGVSYLGKRGGFMQLQDIPVTVDALPAYPAGEFTLLTAAQPAFAADGLLQLLDDCSPTLRFAQADIYDPARITVGSDRLLRPVVLPYRLIRSSRSFSLYEHITPEVAGQ